jgi:hypothetical protein
VIAVVCWAISTSPTYQQCIEQRAADSATAGNQQEPSLSAPPILWCGAETLDANHELVVAVATIVIAIFTISLWAATNRLRWSTDRLWEAGERQLVTANRTWVFAQPWPGDVQFRGNEIFFERVEVRNRGNSPATVTALYVGFSDKEPSGEEPTYPQECINQIYNLGPGDQWLYKDRFTTTLARPFVFGFVRYIDQFGHRRESRYCYRLVDEEVKIRTAGSAAWSRFT